MSRWVTILLGAAAIVGVIWVFRAMMAPEQGIRQVEALNTPTLDKPVPEGREAREGMAAVVRRSVAERRPIYVPLTGQTEASRIVPVKAQTAGSVTSAPVTEGKTVAKDALLCGLDLQGKDARLREAEADLKAKDLALTISKTQLANGIVPQSRVDLAEASLDAARAALDVARVEMSKTQIRAPFAGVFEKREAEIGDYMGPGDTCGVVVELDPMVVRLDATAEQATRIRLEAPARLRLSDGKDTRGKVRFVSRTPDPDKRTYEVKIAIDNPGAAIPVGRKAEVRIQVGEGDAHKIPTELLFTDRAGRIGVRFVDVGGLVAFVPADVVDESTDGVWVSGLPPEALIIAEGQEIIYTGLRVRPVFQDGASATLGAPSPTPAPAPSPSAKPK